MKHKSAQSTENPYEKTTALQSTYEVSPARVERDSSQAILKDPMSRFFANQTFDANF
jgi:hypothetical protein